MFETEFNQLAELDGIDPASERDKLRAATNARIRETASQRQTELRTFLTTADIRQDEQRWNLMSLIEALAGDPVTWIDLLRWYFPQLVEQIQRCPEPAAVSLVLSSYGHLEQSSATARSQLLQEYIALTKSPHAVLRQSAVDLLGGFEIRTSAASRAALVRLLADPDWRVRRDAEALLREEHSLPVDYQPRLLDRFRRAFTS